MNSDEKKTIRIVYQGCQPKGIRSDSGYLIFFPKVERYPNQDDRYEEELNDQKHLAEFLAEQLQIQ